jgi:predicted ArsR family transcriptional regulator
MIPDHEIMENRLAEQKRQLNKDYMVQTVDILERMKQRFGPEVYQVVEEVVAERTIEKWREIAQREKSCTIDDLIRILWEPLIARGFEFSIEKKGSGIQFYCTKCAHHELAREINGTDWMFYLKCASDPYIVKGFNPKIVFHRTKTLMQGHDCCDHYYEFQE